jgi:adenylate cyclase
MNPRSFFAELKRRNVIRMAGLYLVGAWLLTQVASTILPMFGTPEWLPRTIVLLLAIGFVPALIFSWVFELTPQGLKRDEEVAP